MWEYFDGHIFEEVRRKVGEWEVQIKNSQLRIQVFEDRDGRYSYRTSMSSRRAAAKLTKRKFSTIEQALQQAIREIKDRIS